MVEKLQVSNSNFKEIFTSQRSYVRSYAETFFSEIKTLQLTSLWKLNSIGLEHTSLHGNLETLEVQNCPCLINLTPSTVSFSNLSGLCVIGCHRLVYLFTSSTAKSLALLEELTVERCRLIKHIVAREGDETDKEEITFGKLKTLSLAFLQSLGSFQAGNSTLNLPSLELVIVHQCCRMKIFSHGAIKATEHLRVSTKPPEHLEYSGMDLNVSIELIFCSQLATFASDVSYLKLGDHPELQEIWGGVIPVPEGGFPNLRTLTVDGCQSLTHVIPSHLVSFLCNMECLTVRNCNAVKAIFDVSPIPAPSSFALEELTLEQLPNLEHVWDEDPKEILSFQCLQKVYIDGCNSLKSLFPASMAQGKLESLEDLKVKNCEQLVEIVAGYESVSGGATSISIIFAGLTMLKLHTLPELKCIHPTLNLEWPKLEKLVVYCCGQLKNFPTLDQDHLAKDTETTITLEKVFPNLGHLSLSKENIMQILQAKLLQRVKFIKLKFFNDDLGEFPYEFFQKESLPHLEELQLSHSNFKKIFTSRRSDLDGYIDALFSQLKTLELRFLSKLNSIGLEHTHLPEDLKILKVDNCPCLIYLAPSTVSFTNLKDLDVGNCDGLVYLFTSSTAKSLALLEELSVIECGSIQEIVAKGDGLDQDEIKFENLKKLYLHSLPRLDSFYTGRSSMKFPSLEQVSILNCSQMKIFSPVDIYAPANVTVIYYGNNNVRAMMEKAIKKAA
ncbi:uncharacterized protein LOC129289203 [Prosopis cineraria]|uniref:uncharacterized protein LOC129289203 n=1 Tax=Prosopis cineraria TaxID=364024 RepID=UPI00241098EA|nr:uncharacterized protein LOC129289203 [Prosopis cineraria]